MVTFGGTSVPVVLISAIFAFSGLWTKLKKNQEETVKTVNFKGLRVSLP